MFGTFGTLRAVKHLKRLSEAHPWLVEASVRLEAAFNNPDLQPVNGFIEFLQTRASEGTCQTVANQLADNLVIAAESKHPGIQLREQILQLLEAYSPLRVLFTRPEDSADYDGLHHRFAELLELEFAHFIDEERSLEEIHQEMFSKMMRMSFDILVTLKCLEVFEARSLEPEMDHLLARSAKHQAASLKLSLGASDQAELETVKAEDLSTQAYFLAT